MKTTFLFLFFIISFGCLSYGQQCKDFSLKSVCYNELTSTKPSQQVIRLVLDENGDYFFDKKEVNLNESTEEIIIAYDNQEIADMYKIQLSLKSSALQIDKNNKIICIPLEDKIVLRINDQEMSNLIVKR